MSEQHDENAVWEQGRPVSCWKVTAVAVPKLEAVRRWWRYRLVPEGAGPGGCPGRGWRGNLREAARDETPTGPSGGVWGEEGQVSGESSVPIAPDGTRLESDVQRFRAGKDSHPVSTLLVANANL